MGMAAQSSGSLIALFSSLAVVELFLYLLHKQQNFSYVPNSMQDHPVVPITNVAKVNVSGSRSFMSWCYQRTLIIMGRSNDPEPEVVDVG